MKTFNKWRRDHKLQSLSKNDFIRFFDEMCKEPGIYIVQYDISMGKGHATIFERMGDGKIVRIEPQTHKFGASAYKRINSVAREAYMVQHKKCGVLRVDDKIFDIGLYKSIFEITRK